MNEEINYSDQDFVPEKKQSIEEKKFKGSTIVIIVSFLLLLSGFTIYAFISAFQEEEKEQKSVNFPFDKEVPVVFTSPRDISEQIENISNRKTDSEDLLEIIFQDHKNPLFLTEMLKTYEEPISKELKKNIESFSIGVYKGNIFFLTTFKKDVFPIMSNHSEDFFRIVETFTGKERTQKVDRYKKANADIIVKENGNIYGFLNKKTIAITETEEFFLKILDIYRSSY